MLRYSNRFAGKAAARCMPRFVVEPPSVVRRARSARTSKSARRAPAAMRVTHKWQRRRSERRAVSPAAALNADQQMTRTATQTAIRRERERKVQYGRRGHGMSAYNQPAAMASTYAMHMLQKRAGKAAVSSTMYIATHTLFACQRKFVVAALAYRRTKE